MWNYQPLQLRIIGRSFLFMWSWSGPTIGTHIIIIWKRSTITNIKVLTEGCLTQQVEETREILLIFASQYSFNLNYVL